MKASLVTFEYGLNNKIFDLRISKNRRKFIYLKNILKENKIDLETHDINPQKESVLSIYLDVNKTALLKERSPKNILVVMESPIINKYNNEQKYLNKFDLVITWNRSLCDQKNIFWAGYGNSAELIENDPIKIFSKKKKDLCIINSQKHSNNKYSLYKERERAINFFCKSDLDFDLFGYGWDKRQFKGIYRPFNKINFARNFLYRPNTSYRGIVNSKANTLSNYKYSLCFENFAQYGYITEKIFDSIFSGCIPIYWGCPNIKSEIDPDIFIDMRDFSSYKELYCYLKSISRNEYLFKINKIVEFYNKYLNSTHYDYTWANFFAKKCLSLLK